MIPIELVHPVAAHLRGTHDALPDEALQVATGLRSVRSRTNPEDTPPRRLSPTARVLGGRRGVPDGPGTNIGKSVQSGWQSGFLAAFVNHLPLSGV